MKAFNLLNRELRRYIYEQGWKTLRPIQKAAIKRVAETEDNIILAAPTASGKTEAAFLPAINSISDWKSGLKVVYISPLIALINDQFERISKLCFDMDIPVTSWHGEASKSKKKKLLKNPEGILLITPESIEAMLSLRPGEAKQLFSGVEWIILDEIHSFLDNNRGIQLRSLLERLKFYMEKDPRYIGLSATLAREDYANVKKFFISDRNTVILLDKKRNKFINTVSYYSKNSLGITTEILEEIYEYSQEDSMLVFPNSRGNVEAITVGLKKLAKQRGSNAKYFAHHASVSKDMRLSAEEFAKNSYNQPFTIACTSTLELGIDIGSVDSVVQYGAPFSVSSLAQRLGRSGRKTRESKLHFIANDKWSLLQGLAAISLYEEGKLDPFEEIDSPYDVIAHQILSILLEKSGVPYDELLLLNRKYKSWNGIDDFDYFQLINYLIEENYIEILENEAITGMETEKLFVKGGFFSNFKDMNELDVYSRNKKIGELAQAPGLVEGVNIYLGGKVWYINSIDYKGERIYVTKAKDGKPPVFPGEMGNISDDIRLRMKEILLLDYNKEKYEKNIIDALDSIRVNIGEKIFKDFYWTSNEDNIGITTFKGTKFNETLSILLNIYGSGKYELFESTSFISGESLKESLNKLIEIDFKEEDIYKYFKRKPDEIEKYLSNNKYKDLLPIDLQIKYIIKNKLDFKSVREYLKY